MKKTKNILSKSTTVEQPYATYEREGWIWKILKDLSITKKMSILINMHVGNTAVKSPIYLWVV